MQYLCRWYAFALKVYISDCGWEGSVEMGVNQSADLCH